MTYCSTRSSATTPRKGPPRNPAFFGWLVSPPRRKQSPVGPASQKGGKQPKHSLSGFQRSSAPGTNRVPQAVPFNRPPWGPQMQAKPENRPAVSRAAEAAEPALALRRASRTGAEVKPARRPGVKSQLRSFFRRFQQDFPEAPEPPRRGDLRHATGGGDYSSAAPCQARA